MSKKHLRIGVQRITLPEEYRSREVPYRTRGIPRERSTVVE